MAVNITELQNVLRGYDPYAYYNSPRADNWQTSIVYNLTGNKFGIGSQQLNDLSQKAAGYLKTAQDYLNEYAPQLKSIDPYFDPKNFLANTSGRMATTVGGGASSNRDFAVASPITQAYDILKAVQKARDAAEIYKHTGKVTTAQDMYLPEFKQFVGNPGMTDEQARSFSQNRTAYTDSGQPFNLTYSLGNMVNFQPDARVMSEANAAAARIGGNLPYKNAPIGRIAEGGVFQTADQARQAYTDGQLNQSGQNIVNSNTRAPAAGQPLSGSPAPVSPTSQNAGAMNLVKQVLQSGQTTNLQQLPWWNSNPNKGEAYQILNDIFSSPDKLAGFVKQNGITNLQNYSWWNQYPQKQQAWSMIQSNQVSGPGQSTTQAGANSPGGEPGSLDSDVSQFRVNTGNPEIDSIANTYLDSIWEKYKGVLGNIPGAIDENMMKQLEAEVDKVYGPSLTKARQQAEDTYNMGLKTTRGQRDIELERLGATKSRAAADMARGVGEIEQDKGRQLKILGRNYQEALQDMQTNFQTARRTFSGERVKQEGDLDTKKQEDVAFYNEQARRQSDELKRQEERVREDAARAERQLQLGQEGNEFNITGQRQNALQGLDDLRAQAILQRQQQVENLPWQILPSLMNQPSFANIQGSGDAPSGGTTNQSPIYASKPTLTANTAERVLVSPTIRKYRTLRASNTANRF